VAGRDANLATAAVTAALFVGCVWWIRRVAPGPAAA
jgi:hypothetical protein